MAENKEEKSKVAFFKLAVAEFNSHMKFFFTLL